MLGSRAKGDAPTLSQRLDAGLAVYSTVVVQPRTAAELQAFGYSCGDRIAGCQGVVATRRETNLRISNFWGVENCEWTGLAWSIGALTPPELADPPYRSDMRPYRVTQADVDSFLATAFIRLFVGGEKAAMELLPSAYRVEHDVAGWRQHVPLPWPIPSGRLEKFWLILEWPRHGPDLGGPLAVTFRLTTPSEKIQIVGSLADAAPKEKLYVAVGKDGLEQLLEDMLWSPPDAGGGSP